MALTSLAAAEKSRGFGSADSSWKRQRESWTATMRERDPWEDAGLLLPFVSVYGATSENVVAAIEEGPRLMPPAVGMPPLPPFPANTRWIDPSLLPYSRCQATPKHHLRALSNLCRTAACRCRAAHVAISSTSTTGACDADKSATQRSFCPSPCSSGSRHASQVAGLALFSQGGVTSWTRTQAYAAAAEKHGDHLARDTLAASAGRVCPRRGYKNRRAGSVEPQLTVSRLC